MIKCYKVRCNFFLAKRMFSEKYPFDSCKIREYIRNLSGIREMKEDVIEKFLIVFTKAIIVKDVFPLLYPVICG